MDFFRVYLSFMFHKGSHGYGHDGHLLTTQLANNWIFIMQPQSSAVHLVQNGTSFVHKYFIITSMVGRAWLQKYTRLLGMRIQALPTSMNVFSCQQFSEPT